MRHLILCGLAGWCVMGLSHAQMPRLPLSAPYAAFTAHSIRFQDAFSGLIQPAGIARLQASAAAAGAERGYLLPELQQFRAIAAWARGSGTLALPLEHTGGEFYRESRIGIQFARQLGQKADAGLRLQYQHLQVAGYGTAAVMTADAGFLFHLTDQLHTGIAFLNPAGGRFGKDMSEKIPLLLQYGLGYDVSPRLHLALSLEKTEEQPLDVQAGLHYQPVAALHLRAGMAAATSSLWAGVGWRRSALRIDVMTRYHPQLGMTPGLLLFFQPEKKKS